MPTPPIAPEISRQFKAAIETALRDGYAPYGVAGGRGSSVGRAAKVLGIADRRLGAWVRRQKKNARAKKPHFVPDWSLWTRDVTARESGPRKARRWLLTAAQNDTPVHTKFWQNLNAYAAAIGAEIVVGPFTYQLGVFEDHNTRHNVFAEVLRKHLRFERMDCGDVLFCAEMNTLPTAVRPLSGLNTYTRGRWGVFPHAKLALETVPAMPGKAPPIIMTTGCCTIENYIAKKAGLKAKFHHVIGATLVEIDARGRHFCRQINAADDGSFQDLDRAVAGGKVSYGKRVAALNPGDIHTAIMDPAVAKGIWGLRPSSMSEANASRTALKYDSADDTAGCMIDVLRPFDQFFHDLFHGEAINHWQADKPHERYPLHVTGRLNVTEEVENCAKFLRASQRQWCRTHVVESNHDCLSMDTEALTRRGWLRFDDIAADDEVLSFDADANRAVWSPINEKFDRANTEPLVHAAGQPVDMLVTPGHRVLTKAYRPTRGWEAAWSYRRAEDLPAKFAIPVSAPSGLPEFDIADDWLTLAGWLLTDGCIFDDRGYRRVLFSQSKPSPSLDAALHALELKHSVRSRRQTVSHVVGRRLKREPMPNRIYGLSAAAGRRVLSVVPQKRELPAWAFSLSDRQFDVLLDAIVAGDGSWDGGDPGKKICAVVHGEHQLLSSLQACAVAHGWRAHLSIARGKDWRLNLARTGVWTSNKETSVRTVADDVGRVWCLRVPLTNFMVRRNGKPFFTGNCWISRWLQAPVYREDLTNAEAWHRWNLAALEAGRRGEADFSIFRHALREADAHDLEGIDFIPIGASFEICRDRGGIECGAHGHLGPNGSRGTTGNLSRVAIKMNKGHDHTATIHDGVFSAGVCGRDPRLQLGPSSHTESVIVTYGNGKRTIVTLQGDAWRA